MKNYPLLLRPALLIPLLLLLLAATPLAAGPCYIPRPSCGSDDGIYTANSTYEANLRRLEAVLQAEAASASSSSRVEVDRAVGYWPYRVRASVSCRNGGGGDCAACIADFFRRVEFLCPFSKAGPSFFGPGCSVNLGVVRIIPSDLFGRRNESFSCIWAFQAIGFACVLFLLLQEWRSRRKGTTMLSTPLLAEEP